MRQFKSFAEFWPYYLQEHARPGTRLLHYVGTTFVIALFWTTLASADYWLFAAMPLAGYGFAWIAHAFIEHNRPATFSYPIWSLMADFLMWYRFVAGHMMSDLRNAGIGPGGEIDPALRL